MQVQFEVCIAGLDDREPCYLSVKSKERGAPCLLLYVTASGIDAELPFAQCVHFSDLDSDAQEVLEFDDRP